MYIVKRFLRQDRDYFANNAADIQRQNSRMLRAACALYLLVLAIYTGITAYLGHSRTLTVMYLVYDAVHLALCAAIFWPRGPAEGAARRTSLLLGLFEASILSFFVLEAVFPFPSQQSIYFPFPIILLVTVFIHRPGRAAAMILSYSAVFLALVFLFKDRTVWLSETFLVSGTLISSLAGYVIVANLRHETGGAIGRLKYLSMIDGMTGLYNKGTLESLCRAYMEDRSHQKSYAMLFFDVDDFKRINDSYGHPFGDTVLKSIADVMRDA